MADRPGKGALLEGREGVLDDAAHVGKLSKTLTHGWQGKEESVW